MTGNVADVTFDNVKYGQTRAAGNADLPLSVTGGAQPANFTAPHGPVAAFTVDPPVFTPGQKVTFTAQPSHGARYTWLFGDGTQATGRRMRHRFPDAEGTELNGAANGAGRFRVLLRVEDEQGRPGLGRAGRGRRRQVARGRHAGGRHRTGTWLAHLSRRVDRVARSGAEHAVFSGDSPTLHADAQGFTHYAAAWDGFIDIPADGGYSFHLLARDGARLVIDGIEVARTGPPFAQVCGSPGNAMRYDRGSLGLRAGKHSFHLEGLHSASQGAPRLLWEGPALPLTDVPPAAYSHLRLDVLKAGTKGLGTRD